MSDIKVSNIFIGVGIVWLLRKLYSSGSAESVSIKSKGMKIPLEGKDAMVDSKGPIYDYVGPYAVSSD